MNDKQVQDLVRGLFMNQMLFRIMDNSKVRRHRVQQSQEVQKMPLVFDVISSAVILFWVVLLGGTLLMILGGLLITIFE